MVELRVIAHRGIRGTSTENSLVAFRAIRDTAADAVEFDIQATKDGQLVVLHTMSSPQKIFGINKVVDELTWKELSAYRSKSGERIPSFDEVMRALSGKPVMIDVKSPAAAKLLVARLKESGTEQVALVNSLHPEALLQIKHSFPTLNLSLQTYKRPLETIRVARELGLSHVNLVLYLLNPLTYLAARRSGLKILTYQNYASFLLTWRWFVRLVRILYPGTAVISDRADKTGTA